MIITKGSVIWLTGLSGSGKSTIASNLVSKLLQKNILAFNLDGDNLRNGLCSDLKFSISDRNENIRRAAEISKLLANTGTNVIASFISPYIYQRTLVKNICINDNIQFLEIFVNTPLEICELRDTKGLYKKARNGEILNFTGVNDPYEPPLSPNLVINTHTTPLNTSILQLENLITSIKIL